MKHTGVLEKINKWKLFLFLNFLFWFLHWFTWLFLEPQFLSHLSNLLVHLVQYSIPILSTFGLRYIYKKYYVQQLHLFLIAILIIVLSILCGILWVIEHQVIVYLLWGNIKFNALNHILFRAIWYQSYPFVAWSTIYVGFKFYEEYILQKQNAERAASLVQGAQLEMLRYQLNPHFLFNTLSSLRALVRRKENDIAEEMVTKISEFLKYSLLEGEDSKVSLSKEIKTINHYFDIEKVRFGEQLKIEYNIDPATEKYYVPVFLIHSLIENAVKHGMKTSPSPLSISVKTEMINGKLRIEILNSGRWIEREARDNETRTGMENTRKRLKLAYPNNHTFEIIKNKNSVHVRIIISENANN